MQSCPKCNERKRLHEEIGRELNKRGFNGIYEVTIGVKNGEKLVPFDDHDQAVRTSNGGEDYYKVPAYVAETNDTVYALPDTSEASGPEEYAEKVVGIVQGMRYP